MKKTGGSLAWFKNISTSCSQTFLSFIVNKICWIIGKTLSWNFASSLLSTYAAPILNKSVIIYDSYGMSHTIICNSYLIVILAISMMAAGMKSIISNVIFVLLLTSIWSIVTAESAADSFRLDATFRKIETSLSRSIFDQPCPSGISPLAALFNALQSVLCADITCLAVINLVFELPILFCKIFLSLYFNSVLWNRHLMVLGRKQFV